MYELICITLKVTTTIFDFSGFSYQDVERNFDSVPTLYQQDAFKVVRLMKTLTHRNYSMERMEFSYCHKSQNISSLIIAIAIQNERQGMRNYSNKTKFVEKMM